MNCHLICCWLSSVRPAWGYFKKKKRRFISPCVSSKAWAWTQSSFTNSIIRVIDELFIFITIRKGRMRADFVSIGTHCVRIENYIFFFVIYFTETSHHYELQDFHYTTQCKPGGRTELVRTYSLLQACSLHHSLKPPDYLLIVSNFSLFPVCSLSGG